MTVTRLPAFERDGVTVGIVSEITQPDFRPVSYVVAAAQPIRVCDRCGQDLPIYNASNLITIGNHGQVEHFDRQHGCGAWAPVVFETELWAGEDEYGTLGMVAVDLVKVVADEADRKVTQKLWADLLHWTAHLDHCIAYHGSDSDDFDKIECPLHPMLGSDTKPGIQRTDDGWSAWAQNPCDPTYIMVFEPFEPFEP
jgi:hypothetical protein